MELTASFTVQEVLQTFPKTAEVFLAFKTDCVGCYLERFCTLDEVAQVYGFSLEVLLQRLGEAAQIPSKE